MNYSRIINDQYDIESHVLRVVPVDPKWIAESYHLNIRYSNKINQYMYIYDRFNDIQIAINSDLSIADQNFFIAKCIGLEILTDISYLLESKDMFHYSNLPKRKGRVHPQYHGDGYINLAAKKDWNNSIANNYACELLCDTSLAKAIVELLGEKSHDNKTICDFIQKASDKMKVNKDVFMGKINIYTRRRANGHKDNILELLSDVS